MEIYRKNINLYSKTTNSPKAVGFFFMLFGLAFVIVASVFLISQERFKKNAIQTTGVVVENVRDPGSSSYKTMYSYFDEAGNEHITIGTSSSNPPEYKVGTEITVYYSRTNPDKSVYKSSTVKIICSIFLGLGGLFFIVGLIMFILNRNKEVVWEESGLLARKRNTEQEREE